MEFKVQNASVFMDKVNLLCLMHGIDDPKSYSINDTDKNNLKVMLPENFINNLNKTRPDILKEIISLQST